MKLILLENRYGNNFPASQHNKKWVVEFDTGTRIYFGDNRYQDYTQHGDLKRKKAYISRHKAREDWNDYTTAGFWAKHILWNKPDILSSLNDTLKQYPELK